jgi:uncharacterized protein Veg
MPQDQMLADVKKIVERHNGRRVILSVDNIVGGSRRAGTAAMVIEEKLEYVFLLRFDKTPVLNSIIYVDKCLLLLINKLQLEHGFGKIINLGPTIFDSQIFYYNKPYKFNNRINAVNRDIFKHMGQIPDPQKRKLMKIVANFFDVSF